nr:MAG TPA: hypothetical protein [Myoviridae sp. ctfuG5]
MPLYGRNMRDVSHALHLVFKRLFLALTYLLFFYMHVKALRPTGLVVERSTHRVASLRITHVQTSHDV